MAQHEHFHLASRTDTTSDPETEHEDGYVVCTLYCMENVGLEDECNNLQHGLTCGGIRVERVVIAMKRNIISNTIRMENASVCGGDRVQT